MAPPAAVDHVLVPVPDLDAAGRDLAERYGLPSLAGGLHPGVGTANRIVALGTTYIELIAVVDPDAASATGRGRRVLRALSDRRPFVTWAARCGDVAQLRREALAWGWGVGDIEDGARQRPDGEVLRWRSMDLFPSPGAEEPGVLPFVIEWAGTARHPGQPATAGGDALPALSALHFEDPDPRAANAALINLVGSNPTISVDTGPSSGLVWIELTAGGRRIGLP